jgi:hypothetical protein
VTFNRRHREGNSQLPRWRRSSTIGFQVLST